ncbi:MAG TPA: cytochrome B [Bacteroidetes bacterium]|nr:cytochrome B [Bacteroidota bacterium]
MLKMLVHMHSGFRWIVLILLVAATFKALMKWRSNAPFTEGDRKLNLFTMVSAHIQLLLGLILYFTSQKVVFAADTMKDATKRFFAVEHSVMMLLAIILITIGHAKSKKAVEESKKYKAAFTYFLIALLIILAGIPWPFRNLGGAWF